MNSVLKIALLLVGGYLLLDWFQKRQQAQPAGTAAAPPAAAPPALDTKTLVYQMAAAANPDLRPVLLNADQWNYYYQLVRGVPGPAWETVFPGAPAEQRGRRMTVEEWWAAASPYGLSGLKAAGRWPC
jgi:hypothetical protein